MELTDRQLAVREHFIEAIDRTAEDAPAAIVGLSVQPNGVIRSVALQLEPEHVIPVLTAMRILMDKLESYLTSSLAARHLLLVGATSGLVAADLILAPAIAAALSLIK